MSTAHVDIEFARKNRNSKKVRLPRSATCVAATLTLRRRIEGVIEQANSGRLRVAAPVDIKFHFPRQSPYVPEAIEFVQQTGLGDADGDRNLPRNKRVKNVAARPHWIQVTNECLDRFTVWNYFIYLKLSSGAAGDFVIDPEIENTDIILTPPPRKAG